MRQAATRIAGRSGAHGRAKATRHDAYSLPQDCDGFTAVKRNPQHEPMRLHMRTDIPLAEDMSALKVGECLVMRPLTHEVPGQARKPSCAAGSFGRRESN
jgi:hypothetical protein